MKKIILLGYVYMLFGFGATAQTLDTLVLYAGGPNYVLNKGGFTSTAPLEPCSTRQTDLIYNNAVGLNLSYSKKIKVGDTTRFLGLSQANIYSLKSDVPIKRSVIVGYDTLLTSQVVNGMVEVIQRYQTLQPYILITNAVQTGGIRSYTEILCEERSTEVIPLRYKVVVENKPKLLNAEYRLCSSSPIANLFTNVDNPGGTFSITKVGEPLSTAKEIPLGFFDPTKYGIGKYTVYYKKKYDNDTTNSTLLSFTLDLGVSSTLSTVVSKDTISQGDIVSFQAKSTLLSGDQVTSTEWDFGDKSTISKIENPSHYFLEAGTMKVTVKQSTKLGCTQTVSRNVIVKPLVIDTNALPLFVDTLVLYKGGPNYILKKEGYTSSNTIQQPCSYYQSDAFYTNAVPTHLAISKKTAIGDITYMPGPYVSKNYSLKTLLPIKAGKALGTDTLLTTQVIKGTYEIVQQTKLFQPYIQVKGAAQASNYKAWTNILCKETVKEASPVKYLVIVEDKPKALIADFKVCVSSSAFNLSTNVDNPGGTFLITKAGESITLGKTLTNGLFDPSTYEIGKYTVYYKKNYDNDLANSTLISFSLELIKSTNTLSLKASKDTIKQGDFVSFQATSTLQTGDQVTSTEWDFGDKTIPSKIESPLHYYLETGAMTVTVKQGTKLGCTQTLSKKAVFVKPIMADTNTVTPFVDTLVLYKGGPSYVLKKTGYIATAATEPCSYFQTDAFYDLAVATHLAISKKTTIGDITYLPGPHVSKNYSLKATIPIKAGKVLGSDTLLTNQVTSGTYEIVQQSKWLQPYILVKGAAQTGNYKSWTSILCKETVKEASPVKYFVRVEDMPKAINPDFKVCVSSSSINLAINVDNLGGTFSITKSGDPASSALVLPGGIFEPKSFGLGKYTIYYRKTYDNDISGNNSSVLTFALELMQGNTTLSLKASKDTIVQGDAVSFEATSTLLTGDVITTTDWDFGDNTPPSKIEKPFHYYLDTGIVTVTVKQATKLGCLQTASKKALYVKPVKIDIKTEANGPFEFSYENNKENYLRLYPNPVKSTLHFTAYLSLGTSTLSLRRVLDGAIVFEKEYPWLESAEIDMSSYAAGLYLLQVKPVSGEVNYFKIIKE